MGFLSTKQFRKLITIAFLVLVIAGLAVALVLWLFLPREQVAAVITRELSNRFNQDISMGTFSVGFYPDVEFVARNVRLVDPPTSREILTAKKVRFDINLRELLRRRCVVESITVGSPRLDLLRDVHGAWNVNNLIGSVRSGGKKDETTRSVSWLEFGKITIKNGSIKISDESIGQKLNVSSLAATFDVRGETLHIDSASINLPSLEAELSGTISHPFNPAPGLDISATLDIKKEGFLSDIETITVPPGRKIADISLEASGNIKRVRLDTTFSLNPLVTAQLTTRGALTGTLQVEEGLFTVDVLNTHFGKSTFSLSGTFSDLWQKERSANLKGSTDISVRETAELVKVGSLLQYKLRGIAAATINLTASAEHIGFTTTIDLDNTNFSIPHLMDKTINTPSELALNAHYTFPDELVVDNFELTIGRDKVRGALEGQPGSNTWLKHASLATSNFSLKHLNRLPAVKFAEGTVDLSAKVWQSKEGLQFSGDAEIDSGTLSVTRMNQPFTRLDARINADNKKATMHTASFFFGDSHYRLDAKIKDLKTPHISGQLCSELLDINDIIDAFAKPKKVSTGIPSSPEITPPDFSLELHVEADAMHVGKVKTGAVSTIWQTSGRVQKYDPLQIEAFGGTLEGMFELALLEDGVSWRTDLSGQDMIIEEILSQLYEESERIKGILSAQGKLRGRAGANTDEVWSSINGKLEYSATKTEFNESPLFKSMLLATQGSGMLIPGLQLTSIASLVLDGVKSRGRTFKVNQMYFDLIEGALHITDGVAHTEEAFFDGDTVDLFFKGDIDLVKKEYNMQAKAVPIGTIGLLFEKIPVLGKQIERLRNATLSFSFHVTGPLTSPNVQLSTLEPIAPKSN